MRAALFSLFGILLASTNATAEVLKVEAPPDDNGLPRFEVRSYRFQKHKRLNYERLVVEFARKDDKTADPSLMARPNGKESTILVEMMNLAGAFPEAALSDSYLKKSSYLGQITAENEGAGTGFALKVKLKEHGNKINAFWLSAPPRMVIDAYGSGGASVGGHASHGKKSHGKAHAKAAPSPTDFMCFPAGAQVGLNVVFSSPTGAPLPGQQQLKVNLGGTVGSSESGLAPEAIVCYPRSAQVKAKLAFEMKASEALAESGHAEGAVAGAPANDLFQKSPTAPASVPAVDPRTPATGIISTQPVPRTTPPPAPTGGSLLPPLR